METWREDGKKAGGWLLQSWWGGELGGLSLQIQGRTNQSTVKNGVTVGIRRGVRNSRQLSLCLPSAVKINNAPHPPSGCACPFCKIRSSPTVDLLDSKPWNDAF